MLPDVPEASGLAISRRTPGLLWTHNDSGHDEVLYAIDQMGTLRGKVRVPTRLRDWEDVSAAPCNKGGDCLYIGDIGDNDKERDSYTIYRLQEPAQLDQGRLAVSADAIPLVYPDKRHNAEKKANRRPGGD